MIAIGETSRRLGVSVQTLRLYEKEGLVLPHKTDTGRRMYSLHDLERLSCVRRMLTQHGLNLKGIRQLLALIPCWDYRGGFDDDCKRCPVYSDFIGPCWSVSDVGDKCKGQECRRCEVYRLHIKCDRMKEIIHGRRRREMLGQTNLPDIPSEA